MLFLAIFFSLLLALLVLGSGTAKLRRVPRVADTLARLGVSPSMQLALGRIEVAAAVGLVLGVFLPALGVAAAIGLVAYFIGAITYHMRAGDPVGESGPAVLFGVLAVVTAVLRATTGL